MKSRVTHLCLALGSFLTLWCASQAGAAEKGIPLYKHIAELAGNTKLVRAPPQLGSFQLHAVQPCLPSSS